MTAKVKNYGLPCLWLAVFATLFIANIATGKSNKEYGSKSPAGLQSKA